MAKVYIDGQELEIGDDQRLNGIQAAKRLGVEIPHYCWHPGLVGRGQLPHVPGRNGHGAIRRRAKSR